jgi:phosphate transport system protein
VGGALKTRRAFHEELRELEEQALAAADLAAAALNRVMQAVTTNDADLAKMVVEGDDQIDHAYLEVHQGILSLLARQSPVASDLRLVSALLHTIVHIERIGDLCVNTAKLVPLAGEAPAGGQEVLA